MTARHRDDEIANLLLQASLLDGAGAVDAWEHWRSLTTVDELPHDQQWLLGRLYCNLVSSGVSDDELVRYASVYRHHWYRNLLLLRAIERTAELRSERSSGWALFGGAAIALERPDQLGARPCSSVQQLTTGVELLGEPTDAELIDRARPLTWRGRTWWVLDPADHLVAICLHRDVWETRSSLLWLSDAATLIRLHPGLDRARVDRLARRLGRVDDVAAALGTVAERCGVTIPDGPLVSVVIPMYNAERHVGDALRSVMAQTHRSIEIIVVDDGSTDRSAEVVAAVGDDRCRLIRQPNAGAPTARNVGVAAARGGLLAFIDADDVWTPRKLEVQVRALADDPGLAMVFGFASNCSATLEADAGEISPGYSLGTILVRREAFEQVGELSTHWRVGDFIDWYARAEDLGLRHAMLDDVALLRRVHAASMTASDRAAWADYPKIVREMRRRRSTSP